MGTRRIYCAVGDKALVAGLIEKHDISFDYWDENTNCFYYEEGGDDYYSNYEGVEDMMKDSDCPMIEATSEGGYDWLLINYSGVVKEIRIDINGNPAVSVAREPTHLEWQEMAEALLYYEFSDAFEIYKKMMS